MKVSWTTAIAVMMAAIFAVSSALADNSPPAVPADTVTTATQPVTTTVDPVDLPGTTVASVPVGQVPQTMPAVPAPALQLQSLLIKQVRSKIVMYRGKAWHLQSLLGLRHSPGGNIWSLGTPRAGKARLQAWQNRARLLRQAATKQIGQDRQSLEYMYRVMGRRPAVRVLASSGGLIGQLQRIKQLKYATTRMFRNPPHKNQFMCIHHYEGSWRDPGSPYYGGLQMDIGFQGAYGGWLLRSKGTADHWTPLEQIWVAEKALQSRGFNPWPNTARYCGLL